MQITLTIFKKIVALLSTQKLSLDDGNVPSSFFNFEQREKINDLISAFISESVECAINADCSMHLKKGDQGVMSVKRVVNRLGWIFLIQSRCLPGRRRRYWMRSTELIAGVWAIASAALSASWPSLSISQWFGTLSGRLRHWFRL